MTASEQVVKLRGESAWDAVTVSVVRVRSRAEMNEFAADWVFASIERGYVDTAVTAVTVGSVDPRLE
jgi:hypothetical protein